MTYTRRRMRRGFTLIEVMAATFMVTFGLVAAYFLVGLGTATNLDAKHTALAYQAAQQEIEFIRNMPYQGSDTFTGLQSLTRAAPAANVKEARFLKEDGSADASRPGDTGYPGYVKSLAELPNGSGGVIITNDATAGNLCKHVTVVVRWSDKGNLQRAIAVKTLISMGGIDPR